MERFAIRRRGTNLYLPHRPGGRGYSNDEPVDADLPVGPRLFWNRLSAERALTAWLQGVWVKHTSSGTQWEDYDERIKVQPQPHRRREDMEIVRIVLEFIS